MQSSSFSPSDRLEIGKLLINANPSLTVIFGIGIFAATSVEWEDQGSCQMSASGDIRVRSPGTDNYVQKPFCIIIKH